MINITLKSEEESEELQQSPNLLDHGTLLNGNNVDVFMEKDNTKKFIPIVDCLSIEEKEDMTKLLHEFLEFFAWNYSDMPGIDPQIVTHTIVLKPDGKPFKQKIQKINPKIVLLAKDKIEKLLQAVFIHPIDYSPWILNIVVFAKLDDRIHMCTNFRDLNLASLNDDFPHPNIYMIVDSIDNHELLSFMDGFFGYNQIFINHHDQYKITFITPWGTFCWVVMLFGHKNARETYQHAMTLIFHDYMQNSLEDYVDDILAKYIYRQDHTMTLRLMFE